MPRFLKERLRGLFGSRKGNVTILFAFGAPVVALGIAVAIDFSNATIVHTKLNAAADAAALAALTPAMMQQSNSTAQQAAIALFDARIAAIGTLVANDTTLNVSVTNPNGPNNRQVVVTYTVQNNTIMGALGLSSLSISGTSTAQATTPPNINFYLLLDNSPSMALPFTSDGIAQMVSLTTTSNGNGQDGGNGCAFACHQADTGYSNNQTDTVWNPCYNATTNSYSTPTVTKTINGTTYTNAYCNTSTQGAQIDNYALARKNGITLRLDELTTGVSTLMQTANGYQTSGIYSVPPVYQFAAYSMDSSWEIGVTNTQVMALTKTFVNDWQTALSSFGVMEMFNNNNTCNSSACSAPGGAGDVATNFDNALSDINNTVPAPGNGTNQPGDKPQEVVFFVTDGVEDESTSSCSQAWPEGVVDRCQSPINPALCSALKSRGVKVAILYTEYLAVPSNSWYSNTVAPFQPDIGTELQACASPNLFIDAAVGDDLGADLKTLFNLTIQQAALSQ